MELTAGIRAAAHDALQVSIEALEGVSDEMARLGVFGERLGIDLVAHPERAEEPATAWLIRSADLASRRRADRIALEWADLNDGAPSPGSTSAAGGALIRIVR